MVSLSSATDPFHAWQRLLQECHSEEETLFFTRLEEDSPQRKLIERIFTCSPYLTRLIWQYPSFLWTCLEEGFANTLLVWRESLPPIETFSTDASLMTALRRHKAQGALLIALADLTGEWVLEQVTAELTNLAERCLNHSLLYLWKKLEQSGQIQPTPLPCEGLIVLGMGKMGAGELNYSSDIDLVLMYEPEKITYLGRQSLQHCLNRFSQDLSRLMQERTADGYVFRVDLRLRPDPSSTPPVVNKNAAMFYYETVGQNWERAAFIKARPVGGDIAAGSKFIEELRPFLWRRSLDFAAIADIQSIKRQMDNRKLDELELPGHDLKRGLGGIREIEFIAQIHQLIWGGRNPAVRLRGTCETLRQLAKLKLLNPKKVETLIRHYHDLRMVEHRIQMLEDQQTHALPFHEEERNRLALLCSSLLPKDSSFDRWMESIFRKVHEIYRNCFDHEPSLAADGNLSFTGVDLDQNTLETLRKLGFHDAERVAQSIANWHRGTVRAMRTARARELLTELTPTLLRALGSTVDPDAAFANFGKFLERLPAAVQLFSLLLSNTQILNQLAVIMGNAPGLAAYLGKHPDWFDILLTAQYHNLLEQPPPLGDYLQYQDHEEEWIAALCRFRNEREFLIGTEILMGKLDPIAGNRMLTATADTVFSTLISASRARFESSYGRISGSGMAIIALGRYGSHELTFGSDLDLIFLYDAEDDQALSDGEKSYSAMVYYNRLAQRLVGGLEAATGEGRLYAVDTRLRPGGKDSAVATSLAAFEKYFRESAWNFEKMALLRHRIVYVDPVLAGKLPQAIADFFTQQVDPLQLKKDVAEMRERIAREYPANDPWRVKHARGGLIDIIFLTQTLAIEHGHHHADLICADIPHILNKARGYGLIKAEEGEKLLAAWLFQSRLASLLRLCQRDFNEATAPKGLLTLLATCLEVANYNLLKQELIKHQQHVQRMFDLVITRSLT